MLINGFNEACKNIAASYLKVGDESTSEISFRMEAKGNLPHLSYIFLKPYPLGTEFNTVTCSVKGDLVFIKVKRRNERTKHSKYQNQIGSNEDSTKRIMEATKGICQRYRKGARKDIFLYENGLSSKKLAEYVMEVVASLIGMVKSNTKGLYKETFSLS